MKKTIASACSMLFLASCGVVAGNDAAAPSQDATQLAKVSTGRAYPELKVDMPVVMTKEPTDKSHWYIVSQRGTIVRFPAAELQTWKQEVFADLTSLVVSGGERGLLGLAFHPNYPSNASVFVNYTTNVNGSLHTVVSRFQVSSGKVDLGSEQRLLLVEQPYANHNGGQIDFGPDGYLYIALGDGGSGGDPKGHGQNKNTLLGSLLRIDVDKNAVGQKYGIPADNPFVGAEGRAEIYAYGLRNPWKFSFDEVTGRLWLADVGQSNWEEVDIIVRGGNYGWNIREGAHCYRANRCSTTGLIDPVAEYDHSLGSSITGGYVYRGASIPALKGAYVYGDFVSGRLWALSETNGSFQNIQLPDTDHMISAFARDENGEMFLLNYGKGEVYQLITE